MSIRLGEVGEVRVFDANLFDDRPGLIHYCHPCVPFVDVGPEISGSFTRDASAWSGDSVIRAFPETARRGIRAVTPMARLFSHTNQSTGRSLWHGIGGSLTSCILVYALMGNSVSIESTQHADYRLWQFALNGSSTISSTVIYRVEI